MAEIVDPVIQNGKSFQQFVHNSGVSINRTVPLPTQSANSGSQRRENMSLRTTSSQTGMNESYGAIARGEKDATTNGMRQIEEKTRKQGSRNGSSDNGTPTGAYGNGDGNWNGTKVMDFFSAEVFQIVLHNPTTAHRFKKFCQSRACGENMEFLEKVDTYIKLLDQLGQLLSSIQSTYISPDATHQINIPSQLIQHISTDVKTATQNAIPGLECIFDGAQDHIQKLLASDIYHRFVKHQVTTSATLTLTDDRERFEGLGDCFCLTDTAIADNPIVFVSDGFVSVTGYSRQDIIPRNCRFLQGPETDPSSPNRLRKAIDNGEETVELLLNYRKNGDPFWNLLYVTPLYDEHGVIRYFLGGQINVSTTVHSYTDVLKVLGQNSDDDFGDCESIRSCHGPEPRRSSVDQIQQNNKKPRSSFFRNFRSYARATTPQTSVPVREEVGMENELVNRMSKLNFKTQVEAFYTAYSKYIIMTYTESSRSDAVLSISYFSPGVIDMLCLNLPNGSIAPIYHKDIFKVLTEHSSSSSITKGFKQIVRDNLARGKAVSVELGLMTGYAEASGGFGGIGKSKIGYKRVEERYVSHWTPMKNVVGDVCWVTLTITPK